tara:strand:+ start:859 stop:1839 length:981 start_codon:yes stop_codon:yes gene_type:complete
MEYHGGLSSEINQANGVSQIALSKQSNVSVLNNMRTRDYTDAIDKKKENRERTTTEDERNAFEKLGDYGTEVGTKYGEYKSFINEGKSIENLRSVKLAKGVGSAFGKAGGSVKEAVSKPSVDGIEVSGTEMTGDMPQEKIAQHTTPQPEDNTPSSSPPEEGGGDASSGSVEKGVVKTGEEAAEEGAETGGKIAGKIAGGLAKGAGGLFSVGMLSSDIYQQVKHKSFIYGENTGDKIGNFMSELGSVADVAGIASADPLLAIAGVGLGAVGSVVSDISELFHHHTEKPKPPPPPPKPVISASIQNIAGSGQVAESQTSSLRSVQAYG